jgi:hypothetical protein
LIQMLMPRCTPWPAGISACTTPRPAVSHCMHTYGTAANQLTIDTMADHKYNIHSSTCMHVNSVTSMHYVRARTSLTNSTRCYLFSCVVWTLTCSNYLVLVSCGHCSMEQRLSCSTC